MRLALLTALCLSLLAGCLPVSIHPLYSADDTYFDPELPGIWTDSDGATWQFVAVERGGNYATHSMNETTGLMEPLPPLEPTFDHYMVAFNPKDGPPAEFEGWLTRVGGVPFLDLKPITAAGDGPRNPLERALLVPAHAWMKISTTPDRKLSLQLVNPDWLRKQLEVDGETALRHTWLQQEWPLITASTHELRWFVEQHLNDPDFFGELGDLMRNQSSGGIQSGAGNQYDSQYRGTTTSTKGSYEAKEPPAKKSP